MLFHTGYQCCYCGDAIPKTDRGAIMIALTGLWARKAGASQDMFAHSMCAARNFGAALHVSVPFDAEAFDPDE